MARWKSVALALLVSGVTAILSGCASLSTPTGSSNGRILGWRSGLGNGTVSSYAEMDAKGMPTAIGIVFSASALDGLPASGSDQHHCFDRNKDGVVDLATECYADYEFVVPLPDVVSRHSEIPFKWVFLNWNHHGHSPPGVWDLPHFDIHFVIEPIALLLGIESGPCSPSLDGYVRCDQHERALKPVPPNYMHPDFRAGRTVVPAMGLHWYDPTTPEFRKLQVFTLSWLYGAYDGKVTFYEDMVTRAFLLSKPSTCFPIKAPPAVGLSGFYPTVSCVRHSATAAEYTVSLEQFIFRKASDPD
jgi:hypothetical protein